MTYLCITLKLLIHQQILFIMERDFICRCNNCMAILIDNNPHTKAIKQNLIGSELNMIQVNVGDENDSEWIWACPNCKTDVYLTDIEPTTKELKVCVIDLHNKHDIEIEQSFDISDEDFLRLAEVYNSVFTLKEFENQMNDLHFLDFNHCFMRFLKV